MNQIGKRIKDLRKNLGLSQAELATNIGITQSKISAIEKMKNYPSFETLIALKDYLNTTYEWLIEGKESVPITNELQELIKYFNMLSDNDKWRVIGKVENMAESDNK